MEFITKDKFAFPRVMQLNRYMEGHAGFIAGGCFKNLFQKEKIKDIDIFFCNQADYNQSVSYYLSKPTEYSQYYENPKVKAFKDLKTRVTVELIKTTFGSPEEILRQFDFSVTKFAYHKEQTTENVEYKTTYVSTFFEHLVNKKLVIDGELLFPISSFERSYRYRTYGFGLCRESKSILINAIKSDSTSEDQLSQEMYFGMD